MKWMSLLLFGSIGLTCFIAGLVWGAKQTRRTPTVIIFGSTRF